MRPKEIAPSARRQARHVTVFLDVDGVLNSFPVEDPRFKRERRQAVPAWHYMLHYRPKIVRELEALVADRLADIVWLSTWSARCRTEIEPALSFRHSYPTIDMPDGSFNRYANDPHTWWKARAVETWLADHPHDRAVWIDDDLAAPVTSTYFREKYRFRMLLVSPTFAHGLDEEQLAEIRAFTYARPTGTQPHWLEPLPEARGPRPSGWRRFLRRGSYSRNNSGAGQAAELNEGRGRYDGQGLRDGLADGQPAGNKHGLDTGQAVGNKHGLEDGQGVSDGRSDALGNETEPVLAPSAPESPEEVGSGQPRAQSLAEPRAHSSAHGRSDDQ